MPISGIAQDDFDAFVKKHEASFGSFIKERNAEYDAFRKRVNEIDRTELLEEWYVKNDGKHCYVHAIKYSLRVRGQGDGYRKGICDRRLCQKRC